MSLCTIIIPSRHRIDQLFRCIDSIVAGASGNDYEIAVRLDYDDTESLARTSELESYPVVKLSVGESPGWNYLDQKIYGPIANTSQSQWVWIMNDDMSVGVEHGRWDDLLREVPLSGFWVQPGIHKLNQSVYLNDDRSCAPCFSTRCWQKFGHENIPHPCDDVLVAILKKHGWRAWFLKGVTVWHQRNK